MLAFERVICLLVIKGLLVQRHDICRASLVFDMTSLARRIIDVLDAAMETFPGVDVCRDLLVTLEAKLVLTYLAETLVAVTAFIFIFCMALNELTRHHQRLQTGGINCG